MCCTYMCICIGVSMNHSLKYRCVYYICACMTDWLMQWSYISLTTIRRQLSISMNILHFLGNCHVWHHGFSCSMHVQSFATICCRFLGEGLHIEACLHMSLDIIFSLVYLHTYIYIYICIYKYLSTFKVINIFFNRNTFQNTFLHC